MAITNTAYLVGAEARLATVEVRRLKGVGVFDIIGLPEPTARETRVRVRESLRQIDVHLEDHSVQIKVTPSNGVPGGGSYDLSIAMAVLGALGLVPQERLLGTLFLGELSLTGAVRPVRGVLPALTHAHFMSQAVVPEANGWEAGLSRHGLRVCLASHLREVVDAMVGGPALLLAQRSDTPQRIEVGPDMSDVRGQRSAKRILEIAAAGRHNVLMVGPPGSGCTLLARRLPAIMPAMTALESYEMTCVYSAAGLLRREIASHRPFRAPHHTVSAIGLLGGGSPPRPGEVTLSHHGVLFLNEMLDFRRSALGSMSEVLQRGSVEFSHPTGSVSMRARPLVVGVIAPCSQSCPMGACACSPESKEHWESRLQSTVLDRFDLRVSLSRFSPLDEDLRDAPQEERSADVRSRVTRASAAQADRARGGSLVHNALRSGKDLARIAPLTREGKTLLADAARRLAMTDVEREKVVRVARTIADLDGSDRVQTRHLSEAIGCVAVRRPQTSDF